MSVELRPPRADEAPEIAELANRVSGELFGEAEETEATVRMWLTTPDLELGNDYRVALDEEGRLTIVRPTYVVGPHDPTDRFC